MGTLFSIVLCCSGLVIGQAAPVGGRTPGELLDEWEADAKEATPEQVNAWVRSIRATASKGDLVVQERLCRIAVGPDTSAFGRRRALMLAAELADGVSAGELLRTLNGWIDGWEKVILWSADDDLDTEQKRLVADCVVNRGLLAVLGAKSAAAEEATLRLAARLIVVAHGKVRAACADYLISPTGAEALRKSLITDVLVAGVGVEPFAPLIDASCFPRLQESVRKRGPVLDWNWEAARVLAHHGDLELVPELKSRRAEAASIHGYLLTQIDHMLWEIEVQHPPEKLLEVLAASDEENGIIDRDWVLRRGTELGLPIGALHDALVEYAQTVDTDGEGFRFIPVRHTARLLGILEQDELSEVGPELPHRR